LSARLTWKLKNAGQLFVEATIRKLHLEPRGDKLAVIPARPMGFFTNPLARLSADVAGEGFTVL